MTKFQRALAIVSFVVVAIACGAEREASDGASSASSAIINGTTITQLPTVEKTGVVFIQSSDATSTFFERGSGTLLSNDWVLTAAHVVADKCAPYPASHVTVDLGDTAQGAQSRTADALAFHPRWGGSCANPDNIDTDVALIHVSTPFVLDGKTTGRSRPISDLLTQGVIGKSTTCYGYGWTSLTGAGATASPPLRHADFVAVAFPLAPTHALGFAVNKGGGSAPSDTGSGVLPFHGDSGGPCVDPNDPFGAEDVFGVTHGSEARFVSGVQDPSWTVYVAAAAFRDFARAVTTTATPPIQFDIDADGLLDTLYVRELVGFFYAHIVMGNGTVYDVPPLGIPGLSVGANRALVQHGDFDKDGVQDLFGYINGVPLYFPGVSGFNPTTPVSTSLNMVATYQYVTPRDVDKDATDDLVAVRADGSEDVYLGAPGKGLTTASQYVPRGFNWYASLDQEALAISAPGFATTTGGGLTPTKGIVWLMTNGGTGFDPFPLYLDGLMSQSTIPLPYASAPGDLFGASLAWGKFGAVSAGMPGDTLVIGAPGVTVGGVKGAGVVTLFTRDANVGEAFKAVEIDRNTLKVTSDSAFGVRVTSGNFDADAYDDLVIASAHDILIIKGTATGITATSASVQLKPADLGLASATLNGGLVTGDFNCDGYEDLAVASPLEPGVSHAAAGAVVVLYGGPQGLKTTARQRLDKNVPGLDGVPPASDTEALGSEMVAGNFNGDGYLGRPCVDLAMSVSEGTGSIRNGAAYVVYGSPDGLRAASSQRLSQGQQLADGTSIANVSEPGDGFGQHMAITRADTDRFDDLIVGVFNEDMNAGAAHVLRGSKTGITAAGQAFWQQGQAGMPGVPQTGPNPLSGGSKFGWSVGGTANGLIGVAASWESFTTPTVNRAGWAALVRVNDSATIGIGSVFEATETLVSQKFPLPPNGPGPFDLRTDAFFGRVMTGARPAFVSQTAAQGRYSGQLVLASDLRLHHPCGNDVTPPVLSNLAATPACLWPPNHKFVSYDLGADITFSVDDNCDPSPKVSIVSVVSSEPAKGATDVAYGQGAACLRSERAGTGAGRAYSVTLEAKDAMGNASQGVVTVTVPKAYTSGCFVAPGRFLKEGDAKCTF
ncbi:MAG: trypsin-like serine protease [Polyangiaceae bacterium]